MTGTSEPITLSPEVEAARDHLEHHHQIFGRNFGSGDAIDKSAQLQLDILEKYTDWEAEIRKVGERTLHSEWT